MKRYDGSVRTISGLQGSLFDQGDEIRLGPLSDLRRTPLGSGAWVDHLPSWLSGADTLFERLAEDVPWRAERRRMYEREVDVPRLLAFYDDPAHQHPVPPARRPLSRGRTPLGPPRPGQ